MRLPRVGITCSTATYITRLGYEVTSDVAYVEFGDVLVGCGAVPILLPLSAPAALVGEYLKLIDGLILTGGADIGAVTNDRIEPLVGGVDARKDSFEWHLCGLALHCQIPLLGICRGLQMINVFLGGTLYPDLPTDLGTDVSHTAPPDADPAAHDISISANSVVADLFEGTSGRVNSYHHQGIRQLAPALHATATAPDGLIEAVESAIYRRMLAVQFHPEMSYQEHEPSLRVFQWLVTEAAAFCGLKDGREPVKCREERVG
ncbi:MAG: gamma-glutamyl-gamma-aminobutyrate hydrolase family protein [Chloroflexi bacterium]|nr:gamma-glutamyl-gamma-aminobutyrate hydrolase family protein [Chloroflexota bacterium]